MSSRPSIARFIGSPLTEIELCLNPLGIFRKQPVKVLYFVSTNKPTFNERSCFFRKFDNSNRSLAFSGIGRVAYFSRQIPDKSITPKSCRPLIPLYLD